VKRFADCLAERETILESLQPCAGAVDDTVAAIVAAIKRGGRIYFFGNGGSAAQAQHLAAELSGRFLRERPPWGALALTVDSSALTAIANDYGFENVFARQLDGLVKQGDVAIGLTTSGASANVVNGLRAARAKGATTVAIASTKGGPAAEAADVAVLCPNGPSWKTQEAHLAIGHIICELVELAVVEP